MLTNTANTRWQHSHPGDYNSVEINKIGENTFELKKIHQIHWEFMGINTTSVMKVMTSSVTIMPKMWICSSQDHEN